MKTHLLRTSLLAVVAAVSVHAQNSNFRVNIPFDFIVGSQALPAGQYSVGVVTITGVVTVNCVDHKGASAMIGTLPSPLFALRMRRSSCFIVTPTRIFSRKSGQVEATDGSFPRQKGRLNWPPRGQILTT